jgi:hypothetical protein
MKECLTKPLMSNFSGCLVENPTCQHAFRMGFSYLCSHPRHHEFHRGQPNELKMRYETLRESRRNAYIDNQLVAYKNNPLLADLFKCLQPPSKGSNEGTRSS